MELNNKTLSTCRDRDFEFLRVSGRKVCVVSVKPGFVWNGASAKAAAGQGAVYFRLTKDFNLDSSESSSGDELPAVKFVRQEDSMSIEVRGGGGSEQWKVTPRNSGKLQRFIAYFWCHNWNV